MIELTKFVDLASERLGGRTIDANDEFFAPKSNLLKPSKPVFVEGKFTSRGKWMDGWETRRRRTPGCDWCIVRLGLPGIIRCVVVDTAHFKGNYPAQFSLDALDLGGGPPYANERSNLQAAENSWIELLPETALVGDAQNEFSAPSQGRFTHVRLKIYPDGGVARLRIHGEVVPDLSRLKRPEIDLANIVNGGRILESSDEFFGVPMNLLLPGRGRNMADGWETRRRRGPGHDWTIVQLGIPGRIRQVEVDTAYFKGNFPESCSIDACYAAGNVAPITNRSRRWKELLANAKLKADSRHIFREQLVDLGPLTHVRFHIYPDGGVSRLRVFGEPASESRSVAPLNDLPEEEARETLLDCCGSSSWAEQMLRLRPFVGMEELLKAADRAWSSLEEKDWLEAFRHHPPIGGRQAVVKQTPTARRWSAGEQLRAQSASAKVRAQLAEANRAYYAKFGSVFLICAAGKSADEILNSLRLRLAHDAATELRIAAEEQRKITRLRLEKLFSS